MFKSLVQLIRSVYGDKGLIPLHAPVFQGNEKEYVSSTIDSTFVSSVGEYVNELEDKIAKFIGSEYSVAVVNGTAALHIGLEAIGVLPGDEVLTQSLTFVATCNAIHYCGAAPVFIDVHKEAFGLSADSLLAFLEGECEVREDGFCWNRWTKKRVKACVPMHTFGLPAEIEKIKSICQRFNVALVEDATESLGSMYGNRGTGTFGDVAAISFNGNKIITTGGGGVVVTSNKELADKIKHLTTTAKINHQWSFSHDMIGYNYRMPNLNAALGVAQLEALPHFLKFKRTLAEAYQKWGEENGVAVAKECPGTTSNYWLNTIVAENQQERDELLEFTNSNGIMTRPVWTPMHAQNIYKNCAKVDLKNTEWLAQRLVNIPSGVINSVASDG